MWPALERGEAGDVLVLNVVPLGAEPGDGGVEVAGVPPHHSVRTRPSTASWAPEPVASKYASSNPAAGDDPAAAGNTLILRCQSRTGFRPKSANRRVWSSASRGTGSSGPTIPAARP